MIGYDFTDMFLKYIGGVYSASGQSPTSSSQWNTGKFGNITVFMGLLSNYNSGTEISTSGTGYTRVQVGSTGTSDYYIHYLDVPANQHYLVNTQEIHFNSSISDWGTVEGVALYTKSASGTSGDQLIAKGKIGTWAGDVFTPSTIQVQTNQVVTIKENSLKIEFVDGLPPVAETVLYGLGDSYTFTGVAQINSGDCFTLSSSSTLEIAHGSEPATTYNSNAYSVITQGVTGEATVQDPTISGTLTAGQYIYVVKTNTSV